MASHAGGLTATTTTPLYTGDPWGTSISQLTDKIANGQTFHATPCTYRLSVGNNLHHCPHLLLSGRLQLMLGYLTTKSHSLRRRTGGLLDTSVFRQLLPLHPRSTACQCPIPLLRPLLFLLLELIGIRIVVFLRAIGDQELRYGFTLEITRHDGIQEFALKTTLVYISGSLEKSGQGSRGALTLRRGHCHDPQCSGACQTYFPWPWTRHVDPGSILAEQCTMPDEATKVGMQNTDAHVCAPSLFSSHCVYIYLPGTGNFPSLEIN